MEVRAEIAEIFPREKELLYFKPFEIVKKVDAKERRNAKGLILTAYYGLRTYMFNCRILKKNKPQPKKNEGKKLNI